MPSVQDPFGVNDVLVPSTGNPLLDAEWARNSYISREQIPQWQQGNGWTPGINLGGSSVVPSPAQPAANSLGATTREIPAQAQQNPLTPPPGLTPSGLEMWKRKNAQDAGGSPAPAATSSDAEHIPEADEATGDRIPAGTIPRLAPPGATSRSALPAIAGVAPGGFSTAVSRTLGFEGGFSPRDANGAAVNMGINQAAHPEVNVRNLTREQATAIYKRDYWDAMGLDAVAAKNPALAHVAFDSGVMSGTGQGKKWLAESGGDAGRYMQLREQFQQHLLATDPGKYDRFASAWARRNASLRADIGLKPAMTGEAPGSPNVPLDTGAAGATRSILAPAQGGRDPLMTMMLLQSLFPKHQFTPITYDPYKVMPRVQWGQE